ncbi:hypothetical protein [Mycobacterium palustre]|nr:hypothetical protein [Mycobacterium palustre]MCV7099060.1 hypothetical protein [Mycobacterium palustre]
MPTARQLGDDLPESDGTAVVLGASIAGLLAARLLAEFYGTVHRGRT